MHETPPEMRSSFGGRTASVIALRPLLAFAKTKGTKVEKILDAIALSAPSLGEYDRRIPEASRQLAWTMAADVARDPHFGLHAAEHARMGAYDVLDYSLHFSATLGEAIGHLLRFYRVICDAWALTRSADASVTQLRRVVATPPPEAEFFFALIVLRAQALTLTDVVPRSVHFAHAAPTDVRAHAHLFRSPVRFGCSVAQLNFRSRDMALPVKSANAGVECVLERYMSEIVARLPKNDTLVERVRGIVATSLSKGRPTLRATARTLSASPRTVQRRLAEQGARHADIVSGVRRQLAEHHLGQGLLSVTEVAFLLGFADVTSFTRAYKRWTGALPSRTRLRE